MKIKLRKATALSVAIFVAQERLEVPVDCFSIWTYVDEESHEEDKPIGTRNSNEVHETAMKSMKFTMQLIPVRTIKKKQGELPLEWCRQ